MSLLPTPIAPLAEASSPAQAGGSADSKAHFWDRVAAKCAADPIADMAGYEITLRRVQGLLSAGQGVVEIGCGTGATALRLAPFTRRLLLTDVLAGQIAFARQGLVQRNEIRATLLAYSGDVISGFMSLTDPTPGIPTPIPRSLPKRTTMNHHHRDRLVANICGIAALAAGALLMTACGGSETPSLAYAAPGRHAVGYQVFATTGAQQQPLTLRAWYPASRPDDELFATITYTAPNKFDEQITPGKEITAVGAALSNAQPDRTGGPYPLVVFSHGYALSPIVYSTLVEHYASQGYVVLAPEHNERFDGSLTEFWMELIDRPVDIHRTIDYAEQLTQSAAPLAGLIDMDKITVVGHSYGGYTALAAGGARFDFTAYKTRCAALTADDPLNFFCASIPNESDMSMRAGLDEVPSGLWPSFGDPRVNAVISMAGDAYLFEHRGLAELKVPVMAMGGTMDEGTPYTWGAKLTYDHASSENKALITFPGAGHFLFLDPCEKLPWVENSVYRDAICTDAVWKTRPFDIVKHYTTAFLRDVLDADPEARATLAGRQPHLDNVEYTATRKPWPATASRVQQFP